MYTEKFNKTALRSNDNKRLQTFDRVTTFPHGTNVFKLRENEMLNVRKAKETLKIQSYEFENEMYVTCNIFLKYMETNSVSEMKRYVKFEVKKMLSCFETYKGSILMITQMKMKLSKIKIGHILQIIHTEY